MAGEFDRAVSIVIELEGGDKLVTDTGGLTRYGISSRAYPSTDIKNLSIEQAKSLYHSDYWNAISADGLPWPLSLFVFDAAVNQGKDAAIRMLQQELGVSIDGIVGLNTARAILRAPSDLAVNYLSRRALRYTGTRDFDKYGKGWLNRLFHLAMLANASS